MYYKCSVQFAEAHRGKEALNNMKKPHNELQMENCQDNLVLFANSGAARQGATQQMPSALAPRSCSLTVPTTY